VSSLRAHLIFLAVLVLALFAGVGRPLGIGDGGFGVF
jgi:hypothetical protein